MKEGDENVSAANAGVSGGTAAEVAHVTHKEPVVTVLVMADTIAVQVSIPLVHHLFLFPLLQDAAVEKDEPVAAVAVGQRPRTESESSNPENASPEIEFKPIVSLPLVEVKTLEEEETELLKM